MDLHRRIRTRRIRLSLTGTRLAELSHCSPSFISLIESGRKVPSVELAERIAKALQDDPKLYAIWASIYRIPKRIRPELSDALFAPWDDGDGVARSSTLPPAMVPRGPGRPPLDDQEAAQVSASLDSDMLLEPLRIPHLAGGPIPSDDPPPRNVIASLVSIDARLVGRSSSVGLVALQLDELSARLASVTFRTGDLVIVDRQPTSGPFSAQHVYVWNRPEGLILCRAATVDLDVVVLLPEGTSSRVMREDLADPASRTERLYGTVIWTARRSPDC